MKKKITLGIFLLAVGFAVHAQDSTQVVYTRDIGFNTNIIFKGIFEAFDAPVAIMLKTYNKPGRAMRYGVNLNVSWSDGSGDTQYSNSKQVDVGIVIGKEFQQKIGNSWVWYYGMDVIPGFSYYQYEAFFDKIQTSGMKQISAGFIARPFLAIRFNINPRLYVSAEASFNVNYRYSELTRYYFNPDSTQHLDGHGLVVNASPASGIFIFYRFNK